MADKRQRSIQYQKLRAAGFTVEESNRLKGASKTTIQMAIDTKTLPKKNLAKITQGSNAPKTSKGYKPPKPPKAPKEHHAQTVDYVPMQELNKTYLSNFSFLVSYRLRKNPEKQYITVSSPVDLYKYEVLDAAYAALLKNQNNTYELKKLIKSSLQIEHCAVKVR